MLNSLAAASSQESYGHAIDELIGWYCSEPRLAFNRTVVLRYRFFLEQRNLAPATINVRLAAVRRLAYEASDTGLLSPDLAARIRRVKGAKRLGVRIGNWLSVDEAKALLRHSPPDDLRDKRDRAILAVLIGCGLRRAELVGLKVEDFQIRDEHSVIADLIGKGKHIRTVPVPAWVKRTVDAWTTAAQIRAGTIFRPVNRMGQTSGRWAQAEGNMACRESCCTARWHQESCSARFETYLRPVVPLGGRRTGANTVPARPCIGSDDRALPGLQAEVSSCGQRQPRCGGLLTAAGPRTPLPGLPASTSAEGALPVKAESFSDQGCDAGSPFLIGRPTTRGKRNYGGPRRDGEGVIPTAN